MKTVVFVGDGPTTRVQRDEFLHGLTVHAKWDGPAESFEFRRTDGSLDPNIASFAVAAAAGGETWVSFAVYD